jgi:hypothetical protein
VGHLYRDHRFREYLDHRRYFYHPYLWRDHPCFPLSGQRDRQCHAQLACVAALSGQRDQIISLG